MLEELKQLLLNLKAFGVVSIGSFILLGFVLRMRNRIETRRHEKSTSTHTCTMQLHAVKKDSSPLMRSESIKEYKRVLSKLHNAANSCTNMASVLQCIDIVSNCPSLINVKFGPEGSTAFHRVCLQGHACLMQFMLEKGADPLLLNKKGENALCIIIRNFLNNPEKADFSILNMFLEKGFRPRLSDHWFHHFLKTAIVGGHDRLAQWLILHSNIDKQGNGNSSRCNSLPPIK